MSRTAKIWLIAAGILVVLGPVLIVIAAAAGGFSGFNHTTYETKTYEPVSTFDQIAVYTEMSDIELATTDEAQCRVVCDVAENLTQTAEAQDGTLFIQSNDTRSWYERLFSFSFKAPKIRLYLPQASYASLLIEAATGDISIPKGFTFDTLKIDSGTSDVICLADVTNDTQIKLSTGGVVLGGSSGAATVTTSTGDVELSSVTANGNLSIGTDTGDISLQKTTCAACAIETDTGDIELTNMIAAGDLQIKSTTGDVLFDGSDADGIAVKTTTGDVTGTLLSEKVFITDTSTGDVNVPKTTSGGSCGITTSTGDIKIEISK